jgi:predicted molibdopterin-dependent oxidoreductase YjgC
LIEELRDADCMFVIGSNTTENHPVLALEVKIAARQKGAKVIVADPRRIDLVDYAALHMQQKPGTDVALINGMIHAIISNRWLDKTFVDERTEGFAALAESVQEYTPEAVERITGVPAGDIVEAVRIYAQSKSSSILYAMGITQHATGTNNVLALANLAMVAGQIGKPSSEMNPYEDRTTSRSLRRGRTANVYTGYQRVDDRATQEKFEKVWGALSGKVGLTLTEIVKAIGEGSKSPFILGETPAFRPRRK